MTKDTKLFIKDLYKYSELMSKNSRDKLFSIAKIALIFGSCEKTIRKLVKEK